MNKKFTKYFSIVLSTLIATINIPVVYASSFIVNENFNNMKLHTSPTGYQVSDADSIYTVDINGSDDYCVYLDDKEGQLKLNKPFAPQTEVVNLSVDFMQKQLGSGTHINMTDRTGLRAIRLETRQNGKTLEYVSSDGSYSKLADIIPNVWMNIKVEANVKAQTANIYIDNVLKLKNIPFKNSVSEISYFQTLTPADKVSGHYIDNLQISSAKAPITIPDNATEISFTVDASGQGDFLTVQEAINAIPAKNTLPITINVKAGTYKEVVTIPKSITNLSLVGAGSDQTILTFDNYAGKLNESGSMYGTSGSASTYIKGSNISVEGITFENSFKETGANNEQAIALSVTGNEVQFKNCRFIGNQDTLLLDGGSQYFTDCYIEGDVDFIFGRSQAYFQDCEIRSLNRGSKTNNGYIVAPRTSINENYGFVFVNCKLTAQTGTASNSVHLGRPWTPSGMSVDKPSAAFINCQMDSHIKVEPWTSMSGTPASHGRFFEYQSTGDGAVINPSRPQLTNEEVSHYTISNVLKGWIPSFSVKETLPEEKPPVVTPPTEETPSTPEQNYFTDITPNDSYYDAVVFLAEKGYVKGTGNNLFAPHANASRAEVVVMLSRILNLETTSNASEFRDVDINSWYGKAVQACYETGLVNGISATSFAPNDLISTQDLLLLISRAIKHLNLNSTVPETTLNFTDASNISAYAVNGIKICISTGIIKNEGALLPRNFVTRADMATLFAKMIKLASQI